VLYNFHVKLVLHNEEKLDKKGDDKNKRTLANRQVEKVINSLSFEHLNIPQSFTDILTESTNWPMKASLTTRRDNVVSEKDVTHIKIGEANIKLKVCFWPLASTHIHLQTVFPARALPAPVHILRSLLML
jgi:hypothetical protein